MGLEGRSGAGLATCHCWENSPSRGAIQAGQGKQELRCRKQCGRGEQPEEKRRMRRDERLPGPQFPLHVGAYC